MKKLFLIIAMVFTTTICSFAEDEKVLITINKRSETPDNSTWERAPMRIPVDVYYNTENRVIKVEGSETIEAEIYIYNKYEELVDYSSTINAEFQLTMPGEYTVHIQSEYWYAEAVVNAY
ncbi:MAG: hypothetical protein K2G06_04185 [Muribaculaceae bacterium]|nr:hypothetical protein [Muribaculaceae bacterium]